MKGIIIYENDLRVINAVKLKNASFCYESVGDDKTDTLQGRPVTCASTTCNKDDTYDFETGALIALMKMCGSDKVVRACNEAFFYETDIKVLRKDNNDLREANKGLQEEVKRLNNVSEGLYKFNGRLIDEIDQKNHEIISLKALKLTNEFLKKEKEQIIVAKNVLYNKLEEENEKLKKRINELEIYNNQLEDRVAAEQRGGYKFLKDMEKLQHEYDLCKNSENALKKDNEAFRKICEKLKEENERLKNTRDLLISEKEKLKLDCEKLQHEYNLCKNSENALKCSVDYLNKTIAKLNAAIHGYKEDLYKVTKRCEELEIKESTLNKQQEQLDKREEKISVYFGGRGNGKQYKALIELFKKLPKDKVQAAYVTAYKESLIWCTSQPSIRDQLDSLLESSKYAIPTVDKWLYKPPTKREEMWNDILTCGDCEHSKYVKVKREDLETFAKECNEKKIFSVTGYELNPQFYWSDDDSYTFQIFRKPAGFICAKSVCNVFKDTIVDYLPPMRWDLFKKGRIVVKVDEDNYEDFYNKCEVEIGRKPLNACKGTFTVYYSKGTFHIRPYKDDIPYAKKIVNWEDVR